MADLSAWIERLKSNKFALPAIAIGAVAGGYFLLKGGSNGAGGITAADTSVPGDGSNSAPGAPSGGGGDTSGGNDAAIAALQQQQQGFMSSLVDQFNSLTQSVQAALSGQQSQTQAALDAISQQAQAQAGLQASSQPQQTIGNMPDFSSLFAALQAVPPQTGAYKSPGITGLGGKTILTAIRPSVPQTGLGALLRNAPRPNITPRRPTELTPGYRTLIPNPKTSHPPARHTPNMSPGVRPISPHLTPAPHAHGGAIPRPGLSNRLIRR